MHCILQMRFFLSVCAPEAAQAAPDTFVQLSRQFKERAIRSKVPKAAILSLQTALQKLQSSSADLTPLHGDFFQVNYVLQRTPTPRLCLLEA